MVTGDVIVTRTIASPAASPADTQPQKNKHLMLLHKLLLLQNTAAEKIVRHLNIVEQINKTFVDYANFVNFAMPISNLIEYSDNYSDTSGSLWGFKRDEITNKADGTKKGVKIAVPLKYLSKFWRSLELPLINCKTELSLKWIENCVLTTAAIGADANATGTDSAIFK